MVKKLYNLDDIVSEVKVIIDENESSTALAGIGDPDQLQTDTIIRTLIPHALNRIAELASEDVLADMAVTIPAGNSILSDMPGACYGKYLVMPSDMLRLLSVYAEDWRLPVREFLTGTEDEYYMQKSEFAGIRGNASSPKVALVNNPVGSGNAIEIFSTAKPNVHVSYIPDFTLSDSGNGGNGSTSSAIGWELTSRVHNALIYEIASLYFVTIDDTNRAQAMAQEAAEQLNLKSQKEAQR